MSVLEFMTTLRQALEHVGDAEWLFEHSPIVAARPPAPAHGSESGVSPPSTGIRQLDERLAAVIRDWEGRAKTPLQSLLWAAVRSVQPQKNVNYPALLLLTYFEDPRPRQRDLIRALALGQSTYYRQLNAAVEALERIVLLQLQPSLQLEAPAPRALIGRDAQCDDILRALRGGGVVSLIGASGIGKSALGALLSQRWREVSPNAAVFWHTIRPGVSDTTQHVVFALALFLHQQGQSDLWLHLAARPAEIGPGKALGMIANSLTGLQAPPLIVIDEADLLLPTELDDTPERLQLRELLQALIETERGRAPLLLIGQRLLTAPERGQCFTLDRLDVAAVEAICEQAGLALLPEEAATLTARIRGNPLLLRLFIALRRAEEPLSDALRRLPSAVSLDWSVARLRRHLPEREQTLLAELCVFDAPAPMHPWRKQRKTLDRLAQLGLIETGANDTLQMAPVFRAAFYRQLPDDIRTGLHLAAARICADSGAMTPAARHFALGREPALALRVWTAHRDAELQQGQAQNALTLFRQPQFAQLAAEEDRRLLALTLADLYRLSGDHEAGLIELDGALWPAHGVEAVRMREVRAQLLAMRGDIDAALADYRAALKAHADLQPTRPILLRAELARQTLVRARDHETARREARIARQDVETLLGDIEAEAGDLDAAESRYRAALTDARECGDLPRQAKLCESLGLLAAQRRDTEQAERLLREAGALYQAYGNVMCAVGMTQSNIAYARLMAGDYRAAIAPARAAADFFVTMRQPYFIAVNEANLAEAHANLGELEAAERHAQLALAQEEMAVRANCLYVLGQVRHAQGRYGEAIAYCHDAIGAADQNGDLVSAADARRVLAETLRTAGQLDAAALEFERARAAFARAGLPPA